MTIIENKKECFEGFLISNSDQGSQSIINKTIHIANLIEFLINPYPYRLTANEAGIRMEDLYIIERKLDKSDKQKVMNILKTYWVHAAMIKSNFKIYFKYLN